MARQARQPKPPPAEIWSRRERTAWRVPPQIKPSQWAPRHFRIRRGSRKGPYRHDNAPYLRGIMDIVTRPGCVQANLRAAGQIGKSTLLRILMGFYAHTDPAPMGLTLPTRDKGRSVIKADILPLFRHTPVLRDLIGSQARDVVTESITLLNGFSLDLMWSGSSSSLASHPYQRVVNDECDKFEPWTGEEPDAIAATEGRLTTYGDRRLQINTSTPTTPSGTISRLYDQSTIQLQFHVPCPHCGRRQALRWGQLKWMDLQCAQASIEAAGAARAAGECRYAIAWNPNSHAWQLPADGEPGSAVELGSPAAMDEHVHWLGTMLTELALAEDRRQLADVLAVHRDRAIWYECEHCRGRILSGQKAAMVREGVWTTASGSVVDADGVVHDNAEEVQRWPVETRIGFHISTLYCTWFHWGSLVREWLGAQGDPAALFFFATFRLGEPFEFRSKRVAETLFSAKCARPGTLEEGIVPVWGYELLATIDTQPDYFYVVVRAWGGGLRSQRIWHGKVAGFEQLDHLLYLQEWPCQNPEFPKMCVGRALIDSGGTLDKWLTLTRTQQVYAYVIPRQKLVTAIKGSNRPGTGTYWAMRNPMSQGGRLDVSDLRAIMVDPHKCNDLLSEMIVTGLPSASPAAPDRPRAEQWLLNRHDDAEYNAHMAAVQRTVDPRTRAEIWTPKAAGVRHDYRDCEAYQVAAAYMEHLNMLPDDDEAVIQMKRQAAQQAAAAAAGDEADHVERFRRR